MNAATLPIDSIDRLLLVYNARSGKLAALLDSTRKVLQLDGCTLCSITHGALGERGEWRECRVALGVPVEVYHLDDMPTHVRDLVGDRAPAVLAEVRGGVQLVLGPDVIARCRGSVEDLRGKILYHAAQKGLTLPSAS